MARVLLYDAHILYFGRFKLVDNCNRFHYKKFIDYLQFLKSRKSVLSFVRFSQKRLPASSRTDEEGAQRRRALKSRTVISLPA